MKYLVFLMTVMVVMLIAAGAVVADEGSQAQAPETSVVTPEAQLPVGAGGRMVFIDPATGRVTGTPTAEQRAAMQAKMANMFSQSDEGLVDEFLPNGAVLRDLQGRFMSATVVRIAPDGSEHPVCTTSLAEERGDDAQPNTETAPIVGAAK